MAVVTAFALAGALLLVAAAARRRGGLTATLRAHGVLPRPLVRLAPVAWIAEAATGVLVLVAWAAGVPRPAAWVMTLWFLAMAGYLAVVLRKRGRVPCGCFDEASPASPAKVARAVLLAGASGFFAGWAPVPAAFGDRLLLVVAAAFAAVLLIVADRVADLLGTPAVSGG